MTMPFGNIAIREGEVYRHVASSFSASEPEFWAILRQRTIVPGRESIAARVAFEGSGAGVCRTLRWREMDSNFQFRAR